LHQSRFDVLSTQYGLLESCGHGLLAAPDHHVLKRASGELTVVVLQCLWIGIAKLRSRCTLSLRARAVIPDGGQSQAPSNTSASNSSREVADSGSRRSRYKGRGRFGRLHHVLCRLPIDGPPSPRNDLFQAQIYYLKLLQSTSVEAVTGTETSAPPKKWP
jgi:hypothetical protein